MRRTAKPLPTILMLLPALSVYGLIIIYPMLSSLRYSLYHWSGVGPMTWTGLSNYAELLLKPPYQTTFLRALTHNCYIFALSIVMKVGLGLFLALLLAQKLRGTAIYRAIVFLPITLSMVAVGFLWKLFLNPQWGVVAELLRAVGLDHLVAPWLGLPETALTTIVLISTWRSIGFVVVVLGAGLLAIPQEVDEAAVVDGATTWQRWLHITIPLLLPTILTVLMLEFIWSFGTFDLIYALEGSLGNPMGSTDVLGLLFYRTAFGSFAGASTRMGLGAAVAVTMFVIILPVSLLLSRLRDRLGTL